MYKKNLSHKIVMILLIVILSAYPTRSIEAEDPKHGGTLIIGIPGDPTHLNGLITTASSTLLVTFAFSDRFFELTPDFEWLPALAESWERSEDGLEYTFNLIHNATWHDGMPFTSADVKFTLEEAWGKLNPEGIAAMEYVDSVETPDDFTVVLKMKQIYPPGDMIFPSRPWCFLPKHLYEGTDITTNPYNMKPVSTGPFKFVEWVKGDHITFERNENYFVKGLPYLDRVIYKIIPDATSMVNAFEKGEIDMMTRLGFPYSEMDRLLTLPGVKSLETLHGSSQPVMLVFINHRNDYLKNVDVRKALYHALDRQTIIDRAIYGKGEIAFGPIDSQWGDMFYDPEMPLKYPYEYDVEKANTMLDDAGYLRGSDGVRFKLRLTYDMTQLRYSITAEIMKENYKDVGVELELVPRDSTTMKDLVFKKWDFDIGPIAGMSNGPDPDIGISRTYASWAITKIVYRNPGGYSNSIIDELFELSALETVPTKRAEIYRDIQNILAEDVAAWWLWEQEYWSLYKGYSGLPDKVTMQWDYPFELVWYLEGHDYSKAECAEEIALAENKIVELEQLSYDVSKAKSKLDSANRALNTLDYTKAFEYAETAPALSIAPTGQTSETTITGPQYDLWIATASLVLSIVAIYLVMKKR